jgi:hypothetical protein
MKTPTKSLIFCLLLAALSLTGTAQTVPPLINYQGKLTDAQGNPLPDGDKSVSFTIYGSAAGSDTIWGPQTFNSVPVAQGYFNVMLGPSDSGNRNLVDAFSGPDRYVGISVDGSAISPRQRILRRW